MEKKSKVESTELDKLHTDNQFENNNIEKLPHPNDLTEKLELITADEETKSTFNISEQYKSTLKDEEELSALRNFRPETFQGTERFKIQRRLGAGAFGVVYQAHDKLKNTVVALKVLRQPDPAAIFRFKREFRSLSDVVSPYLATLYELLSDGNDWFFTMEYIEGLDFSYYVQQFNDEQKFTQIRTVFSQLAQGITALHDAGKLHRDIKPSNVLVTKENRVVILDFGLITELAPEDVRQSLTVAGTPSYMSPEQGMGLPLSESSDWYCVGTMLYEALTGQLPFSGNNLIEILQKKHSLQPVPPSNLALDIPQDLESLCMDLLRRDPTQRPLGHEVLLRLGHIQVESVVSSSTVHSTISEMPFVGREEHLSILNEAFTATQNGEAVMIHLQGKSGMGKSALVNHFLKDIQQNQKDVVVLSGRCYEQESVPYKAFDSLVDVLSKYLKRLPAQTVEGLLPRDILALTKLFPVLRQVEGIANARRRVLEIPDAQELRRRAFSALRELLARLAEQNFVVLFIDDFQWGDIDSVNLINELLIPPDAPALLLITGYRSEDMEKSPALQMLLQLTKKLESAVITQTIKVGELNISEAKDLAAILLSKENNTSARYAEVIARESGSSPFFIYELVRYSAASASKKAVNKSDRKRLNYQKIENTTLDEVIWTRVLNLPKQARRFLELIAVAGQPLSMDIAEAVLNSVQVDAQHLALLRAEHLIRISETKDRDEIETFHDRIRETIINNLSPKVHKAYQHRLAVSMESSGDADMEVLAFHFQGSGNFERAVYYAGKAANQAFEKLAFEHAARLYQLALSFGILEENETRRIRKKLGEALVNAGRGAEAAQVFLSATEGAATNEAFELQRLATEQFFRSGQFDEGLKLFENILNSIGMKLPATPRKAIPLLLLRRLQIRLKGLKFHERDAAQIPSEELSKIDIYWTGAIGIGFADAVRGGYFQTMNLLLALKAGEPFRIARSIIGEATFSSVYGGKTKKRTEKLFKIAAEYVEKHEQPYLLGLLKAMAGVAAYLEGRWKNSYDFLKDAEIILREHCKGVAMEINLTDLYSFSCSRYLGNVQEISIRLPSVLKDAQQRGDFWALANLQTLVSPFLWLVKDEPNQAKSEISETFNQWKQQGFYMQHWYSLWGQIERLLYINDGVTAWNIINDEFPTLKKTFVLYPQMNFLLAMDLLARCAIAAAGTQINKKEQSFYLRDAMKSIKKVERENMAWSNATAKLHRAGIASVKGNVKEAVEFLNFAEPAFKTCDMSLYTAITQRRRGELTGGDEGRLLVDTANEWMSNQGIKNPERMAAMLAPGKWS